MFTIRFADVYINSSSSDGIVTAYIENGHLKWWYTHGYLEYFMNADLLFCESIKTIFWIHNNTRVFSSLEDISLNTTTQNVKNLLKQKIKEILSKMYSGYSVYMYNKGLYNAVRKREISYHKEKIKAFPFNFISDIENYLFNKITPKWIHFKAPKAPKARKAPPATDFITARKLFYNDWTNLTLLETESATSNRSVTVIKNLAHIIKK